MKYNPRIHHRRSIRLKGYDYAQEGMYFITICAHKMTHLFGRVENGEMILNDFGKIAQQAWENLPERWSNVELGAFQIMPNHLHGIIVVHRPYSIVMALEREPAGDDGGVGATTRVAVKEIPFSKIQWATRPQLGQIIGAYKSIVFTECLNHYQKSYPGRWLDKIWLRNFHDRIVRDARALINISKYIINNPKNWKKG